MVLDSLRTTYEEILSMTLLLDGTKTFFYVPVLGFDLLELFSAYLLALGSIRQVHSIVPSVAVCIHGPKHFYKIKALQVR